MQAHLKQISPREFQSERNCHSGSEDRLMAQALAADESLVKGKVAWPSSRASCRSEGPSPKRNGIRTDLWLTLHRDFVPDFDCRVVQREKKRGSHRDWQDQRSRIGLARKHSIPVFGPTRNPYDLTKTCGGPPQYRRELRSTRLRNGAACGWQRHGRIRSAIRGISATPSAFVRRQGACRTCRRVWMFTLSVAGPVATQRLRLCLLLKRARRLRPAFSDFHDQPALRLRSPRDRNFKGVRVAMFKDLGLPWEREVKSAVRRQRKVFESLGCIV